MKLIKYLIFLVLIAVIGLSIYIAVQPNAFEVSRSRIIKAPPAVIHETVTDVSENDFSSFWKESETLNTTYDKSKDSIAESYTSEGIPKSSLIWTFKPIGNGTTEVTRKLVADEVSFMTKAKNILTGGKEDDLAEQFKKDLEVLDKRVMDSMDFYSITIDGITEYGGGFYMYKTTSSTASNISNMMAQQFADVLNFMDEHNIKMTGNPFTIYNTINPDGSVIMSNAIPVSNMVTVAEDSNILCGFIDRTRVLKTTLQGNYFNRGEAWDKTLQYLKDNELKASEVPPFEIYTNEPTEVPNPANWITELYIPLKAETPVEKPSM
ncbi:MAG TPA: GyrI-like domain-containing protein [Aquaticitalea sp.]|nr:GyrI-like domain-containing protein [Aquaticitalea sp.]